MVSKYLSPIVVIIGLSILTCCTANNKISYVYNGKCESDQPVITSIDEVLGNPQKFNGKEIQVMGVYKWGFELSAIYKQRSSSNKSEALWMHFGRIDSLIESKSGKNLFDAKEELDKIIDKKILIRGIFESNNKGHLDEFGGGLSGICLVKVFE